MQIQKFGPRTPLLLCTAMVLAVLVAWMPEFVSQPQAHAQNDEPTCFGEDATIVAVPGRPTRGTDGADVIVGTAGADVIRGAGGDDLICGGAGADDIRGGAGDDRMDLGAGHDQASGGPGRDTITGGSGRDRIAGNKGVDRISGNGGHDTIHGGAGADRCRGNRGRDSMRSCRNRDRSAYYVATDGRNRAAGSRAQPWGTIQRGSRMLRPGDTLYVRGGVYRQTLDIAVSGEPGAWVQVRNHPGETPILDGSTLTTTPGWTPLVSIENQQYVRLRGFEIRNRRATRASHVPIGVLISGSGNHIEIVNNDIHRIEHNGAGERNAHGIAAYGTETDPITDLLIARNRVHDLVLGTSEAVVLNGNIDGFEIADNVVYDTDNIGIDVIGYEGVGPTTALDRARHGVIRNNEVHDVDALDNPSYLERSAGGIYVDGGRDVAIENNVVHHSNIGIEIASEDSSGVTRAVTVRNNLIHDNHIGGILVGGYDRRRGATAACSISNNTLAGNDTDEHGNGELVLQYDVRNCEIVRNIIAAGNQGVLVTNPFTKNTGNELNENLYFTGGEPEWEWRRETSGSLAGWRSNAGQDGDSVFADPLFTNSSAADYSLLADSPARADSESPALGARTDVLGPRDPAGTAANTQ